jgi:uncharacterized protein (DUF1015 family)
MPSIKPFKAVIYNRKKIKDIAKVVAPPYDVIPPKMQDELYKKHPNNVVRLILGKINKADTDSDNRYTRSAKDFNEWLDKEILITDDKEAIYIYSQGYKFDGKYIERPGFISLMELELSGSDAVKPHENTLQAPKADRLNLMRSVKANLSPIFLLYEDDKNEVAAVMKKAMKTKPFVDMKIDDVRNRVWKLSEKSGIEKIRRAISAKKLFIADGHHRYETAKNYFNETGIEGARYALAYFCKLDDDSLTVFPTHRLIKDAGSLNADEAVERLEKYFDIKKSSSAAACMKALKTLRKHHAFGMYFGRGKFYCLKLKKDDAAEPYMGRGSKDWKSLDVSILHLFILQNILDIRDEDDNIEFVKDASEAVKAIDRGKFKIAFLLNPTRVSQVKKVAEHGEKMPRKATFFYPKPLSGLVIRKI